MASTKDTQTRGKVTRGWVGAYLQSEFGATPGAAKLVAWLAECSHRTSEKWILLGADPSAVHLARMLRHPKFRDRFFAALLGCRRAGVSMMEMMADVPRRAEAVIALAEKRRAEGEEK